MTWAVWSMRVGFGFDVHRLVSGRPLVLGGALIPFERGLGGHSDADVLVHAVMDALLGAVGLGDIGEKFPDTDPRYAGADSCDLLFRVMEMLGVEGREVVNVDCVVACESPRLAPHIPAMRQRLANILGITPRDFSIKATTTEGLGFTGRGEGIAAWAVALITDRKPDEGR